MVNPADSVFEESVRDSFSRQGIMAHIGATLKVIKSGRTLTICELQASAIKGGMEKLCAHGMATLMCMQGRSDTKPE